MKYKRDDKILAIGILGTLTVFLVKDIVFSIQSKSWIMLYVHLVLYQVVAMISGYLSLTWLEAWTKKRSKGQPKGEDDRPV